ncbi:MAG TPA: glycosyltransferase family 4 protein [Actinomycetota bacterium]
MDLAIVIAAYNRRGGLERVAVEYARGLRDREHTVTVYAQSVARESLDEGITFVRVGGFRRWMALRAATFPIKATHALDGSHHDAILSFGSAVRRPAVVRMPGAHRSWWEFANEAWPATTVDGLRRRLNPFHRITLAWDKRVLGRGMPKAVLAAGAWAAEDIERFYPAVRGRVRALADGVNMEEFSFDEAGRARLRARWGDRPILFTLATELRRKGLGTMLEAFRRVLDEMPGALLVVGGKVPAEDVRALATQHRVLGSVRSVGFVPDDELRAAYSAADALLFPTLFDPWGLPVIEALACGTPVAVSARAGAAGSVRDGETGTVIAEPRDAVQVAAAAARALRLGPDRDAVRASIEHLAWPTIVAELERILIETTG